MGNTQLEFAVDKQYSEHVMRVHPFAYATAGVGGEKHARVAAVLVLLGYVYSRSARVTFAEVGTLSPMTAVQA